MTKRARKLKPSETARQDQYEASARDMGKQPGTAVFTTLYAPPNLQCEWCDCPNDDPQHQNPGYVCDGCSDDSYYLLRLFHGSPRESHVLLCTRHYPDAMQSISGGINSQSGRRVPSAVLGVDILDPGSES